MKSIIRHPLLNGNVVQEPVNIINVQCLWAPTPVACSSFLKTHTCRFKLNALKSLIKKRLVDVSQAKVDVIISTLPSKSYFKPIFDFCCWIIENKWLMVAQTCLPAGAWVGALGLWVDPFEGRVGVGPVSSYHGLKKTFEFDSDWGWTEMKCSFLKWVCFVVLESTERLEVHQKRGLWKFSKNASTSTLWGKFVRGIVCVRMCGQRY